MPLACRVEPHVLLLVGDQRETPWGQARGILVRNFDSVNLLITPGEIASTWWNFVRAKESKDDRRGRYVKFAANLTGAEGV